MRNWIILLVLLALRIFFFYQTRPSFPDGTKLRVSSKVTSEPIRYPSSQYIKVSGFFLYLPLYPEIFYGDFIMVEGEVENGVGKRGGLKMSTLKKVRLIELKQNQGFLYSLRKNLNNIYYLSLPEPHASLVAGVTLGSKATIPKDFWQSLRASGTTHVVVASGMNVALVAKFLIGLLLIFLPRRKALPLALIGVWGYSVMAGFDAPIIRASIMASLAFTAQALGRLNFAWRALILSALIMLFIKPEWIGDIGFILSFVATASLILFEAKIHKKIGFIPGIFRESFSTSLAAQIGVAPIIFFSFGQFNILSPIINALVLWTIMPITVIGMIGGLVGVLVRPLGQIVLYLTYPLTSWFITLISLFST
ncbi:hypothetical protein A2686_01880 [Candidatus Woesebacteria bacterium RIFCSPHIGHO2_01_FULL_38_10]|uniref:ComEC/Rec2-related protein domain-containing protein n=1 Tax=Candidatus Woesebacteria bacterium RIFCSPLOWO2_01_FULL_39_10b TaxID=1802517 RepID=A0A1F8B719_9BACT|nr:MAG: hypothetical protein A2686_01880 [Candidatus Woesebacteria bacterium RIFCSPHIGHO2_01_FULL_38_10]OGM59832.1 MAG: hypothetical protein A2892_00900 [Candidatus Woesebacteria bacterium RIFCSPLOWO2_01_FULL_39_10b]